MRGGVLDRAHQITNAARACGGCGMLKPRPACHLHVRGNMSLRRSRKIAPESIEEGFIHEGERESGEGCSRESISDDQAPLVDHANGRKLPVSAQSSAMEQLDHTPRPESRIGKRFVRYRNSWVGEDSIALNVESLRRVHARLNARSRIIEEADEGMPLP